MTALESLYSDIENDGIPLFSFPVGEKIAAAIQNKNGCGIFIDPDRTKTEPEKLCAALHEYAHCKTQSTQSVYSSLDLIQKHEYIAIKYAVHKKIPFDDLKYAIENGVTEIWQQADYFDVTEDFMRKAIYIYQCEGYLSA